MHNNDHNLIMASVQFKMQGYCNGTKINISRSPTELWNL